MIKLHSVLAACILVGAGLVAPQVKAAPQILGLVASVEPTKLQCKNGVCSAEFSAFCMQEHRKTPPMGTAYRPSDKTKLTLTIAGKKIPLKSEASYFSIRTYTTVLITLPEKFVRAQGEGPAVLSVEKMATLIPVTQSDNPNPQTAYEISSFSGPLRQRVARSLADRNPNIEAVRLISRMINALPKDTDASEATRLGLWEKEIGRRAWRVTEKAYEHTSKAFNVCKGELNRHGIDGTRGCMEIYHDAAMTDVTQKVWKELKPGG